MRLVCSYCRDFLGHIEPLEDQRISHGMCRVCADHFEKQWKGMDLGEYLDTFEEPVVGIDSECRILAANTAAAGMMGKDQSMTIGFRGGEFMECEYARLPEGCGKTEHCAACTIRNTVEAVQETGAAQRRVKAWLDVEGARLHLWISAYPEDGYVRLVIDEVTGKE
jgi:hypothetical protein